MANTVKVEKAMFAHFNQPSGTSKPGAIWSVRISGELPGLVAVRTLFDSAPSEADKKQHMDRVAKFVVQKLDEGWKPAPGNNYFELAD